MKHTFQQVLEHHLSQNAGQKLTPHLVAGLVGLVTLDCRKNDLLKENPPPTLNTEGASND